MSRIDLIVPFSEKDEVKKLGARWDANSKLWYVPDGVDATNFTQWFPEKPSVGIYSSCYFIAQTIRSCWKCGEHTRVYGFILPAGHKTLEHCDDNVADSWYYHDEPAVICYITDLIPTVMERIKTFSQYYRVDFSKTTQSSYWMNHCEQCGIKQGDFGMYCEPQGAFFPMDEQSASRLTLHGFIEPFSCNGDRVYYDNYLLECMRRA